MTRSIGFYVVKLKRALSAKIEIDKKGYFLHFILELNISLKYYNPEIKIISKMNA